MNGAEKCRTVCLDRLDESQDDVYAMSNKINNIFKHLLEQTG